MIQCPGQLDSLPRTLEGAIRIAELPEIPPSGGKRWSTLIYAVPDRDPAVPGTVIHRDRLLGVRERRRELAHEVFRGRHQHVRDQEMVRIPGVLAQRELLSGPLRPLPRVAPGRVE